MRYDFPFEEINFPHRQLEVFAVAYAGNQYVTRPLKWHKHTSMKETAFAESRVVLLDGINAIIKTTTDPESREALRAIKKEVEEIANHEKMRKILDKIYCHVRGNAADVLYGETVDMVSAIYLKNDLANEA